jgi:hypothetical protein
MTATISKETSVRIYNAHREIETCEEMLKALKEWTGRWIADGATIGKSAYGNPQQSLELAMPCPSTSSGSSSKRLYRLPPSLARYAIDAHLAAQQKELAEACIAARCELDGLNGLAPGEPQGVAISTEHSRF